MLFMLAILNRTANNELNSTTVNNLFPTFANFAILFLGNCLI